MTSPHVHEVSLNGLRRDGVGVLVAGLLVERIDDCRFRVSVGLAVAELLADLLPDGRLTVIPRAPHATN
jgi:hypothetical protein